MSSDTPRTDQAHRIAMSQVVGDDYSMAHDEMMLHARQLERELHAMTLAAGVANMERAEWAAERKDLRDALSTLVRIEEEDYQPWLIEPDSELGLAMAAARKALTTWASKQESEAVQSGALAYAKDDAGNHVSHTDGPRRIKCPDCPDGQVWNEKGPTECVCLTCNGTAFIWR